MDVLMNSIGIITIGQGFVKTFDQMIATRFFVGVFDAGLIPGCVFLCSLYYPPRHLQWRLGLITVANICSNIAGNFLAYAIANIQTTENFKGWRWYDINYQIMFRNGSDISQDLHH